MTRTPSPAWGELAGIIKTLSVDVSNRIAAVPIRAVSEGLPDAPDRQHARLEFKKVFKVELVALAGDQIEFAPSLGSDPLLEEGALVGERVGRIANIFDQSRSTKTTANTECPAEGALTVADLVKAAERLPPRHTYVVSKIYPDDKACTLKGEREHFTLMGAGFWMLLEDELAKERAAQANAPYGAFNPSAPPPTWFGVRPFFMDEVPKDKDAAAWHAKERDRILGAIQAIWEKAFPPREPEFYTEIQYRPR